MHPAMLAKFGRCYMCVLWDKPEWRAKWSNLPPPLQTPEQLQVNGFLDAITVVKKCPFLGESIRNPDGSAKTRACLTCGDLLKNQPLFPCLNAEFGDIEVTFKNCITCLYGGKVDYQPPFGEQ